MTDSGYRVETDEKVQSDLRSLANGINFAIASLNNGKVMDFLLILVRPDGNGEAVTLNTITGITDAFKIRTIGEHLIAMANAQDPGLDPDGDDDIQGHA